ncbi:MAG: thioredoxin domain-containing protein [Desulfovibrio sp.]|nr:thioredoxin domain-containing protein [Desulfovibrio sp.]
MLTHWKQLLLLVALVTMFCIPTDLYADSVSQRDELKKFILKTIQDHPQVILDILRNNSETVLDVAQEGSNQRRIHALKKQWKKDLTEEKTIRTNDRPILGRVDAKVRIVAFSDFTCHYCQASKKVIDSILAEYKDKVAFIFKSIPFEEKGPSASAALWFLAIAQQDEDKAWDFYNTMFSEREKLQTEGDKFFRKTAKDMNLDMKKLEYDVRSNKKLKNLLKEDIDDANKLNVEGTPCFFVNNIVVRGAQPLEFFRIAVNMALNEAEK